MPFITTSVEAVDVGSALLRLILITGLQTNQDKMLLIGNFMSNIKNKYNKTSFWMKCQYILIYTSHISV